MIKRNGDNVFAIASSHNQCEGGRGAVSAATRIPRATATRMTPSDAHQNKEANLVLSTYVEKWKSKYEETERKHKSCLLKCEKAKREHDDLQRRYNILHEERAHLESELRERERELNKLRSVSEKLFHEYQQLKHQHEIDAGVMQKVMQQAGEWYKQNKQLKRRSTVLLQALASKTVDIDITDSLETASDTSSNEEVEFLKQTVSELSKQVAELQTELSAIKLQEFEAQEANVTLSQELETEREKRQSQERELSELRDQLSRHNRVSQRLMEEMTALKMAADKEREMADTYKTEAQNAKKRVKVLTHQSTLLLGDMEMDERMLMMLNEVDSLKSSLESHQQRYEQHIEDLQLKLAEKHEDTDLFLWEEKINLAEEDAKKAKERAEAAEKRIEELKRTNEELLRRTEELEKNEAKRPVKKNHLMSRISYFENGGATVDVKKEIKEVKTEDKATEPPTPVQQIIDPLLSSPPSTTAPLPIPPAAAPPPPPPPPPPPMCAPPPPPPPPPPPMMFAPLNGAGDMAQMLACKQGNLKKTKQNGGGAIDAIVDQIKGGKFQLKSTDQNFLERKPKDEQPEAVKEMLSILGTLRKRRTGHRPSFVAT